MVYSFTGVSIYSSRLHEEIVIKGLPLLSIQAGINSFDVITATALTVEQEATLNQVVASHNSVIPGSVLDRDYNPVISGSFDHFPNGLTPRFVGYNFPFNANSTSMFDVENTEFIRIGGGSYRIFNYTDVSVDDYFEFSILDKNDVLGLFSTYGLTVGVDVLELFKYVKTDYLSPSPDEISHITKGSRPIIPGLFLRFKCVVTGLVNLNIRFKLVTYVS